MQAVHLVEGGTRDALRDLLDGAQVGWPVRPEIVESWRRCAAAGLRPDVIVTSYEDPGGDEAHVLTRIARPALSGLIDDLVGTQAAVVLADRRGRIIRRVAADGAARECADRLLLSPGYVWSEGAVGTSGVGTALERRAATFVGPDEHFADAFTEMCSAGAPIIERRTGRVAGVVGASSQAHGASRLLLSLARHVAREVELRLNEHLERRDLVLREHFVRARRQVRAPLALVARDQLMTNSTGGRLVEPGDASVLWESASEALVSDVDEIHVRLDDKRGVMATFQAVRHEGELVGALVRMRATGERPSDRVTAGRTSRRSAARFGWESLSDIELEVAKLAADGRTNREIAARLLMSPHTVDSHIRHIYCKLGIASRVQLTRAVFVERTAAGQASSAGEPC